MSRFEVRKAVIPAAGLGTRFLPATKASPKEMLPLVDKPLIQYAVEEAVAAGLPFVAFRASSDGSDDPLALSGFLEFFAYYRLAARNAASAAAVFLGAGGPA